MDSVIAIPEERMEEAGEAMASAFLADPFCQWIVMDSSARPQLLREMFTLTCRSRLARGETLLGVAHEGRIVAAVGAGGPRECESPDELISAWDEFDRRLGATGVERFSQYLDASTEHKPRNPHVHVNTLAVRPAYQGRGLGRLLLGAVIGLSESNPESSGVGLDTATWENVRFYERSGFHVTAEVVLGQNPHWFMFRSNAVSA